MTCHSLAFAACEDKEIVNGWGGEWVPFIMGSAEFPSGLDMEIMAAMLKKARCRWRNTPTVLPWARHLKLLELGEVDLASAASWTQERAFYAYFTQPYRTEYVAIYVLEENYQKYAGLNLSQLLKLNFKIGVLRGDVYGERVGKFVYDSKDNAIVVDVYDQKMDMLLRNRIDGYIGYPPSDSIAFKARGLSKKVMILPNTVIETGKVHFMLSKESVSVKTFKKLDQALLEIQQDGTLDKIKAKYSERFGTKFY